MHKIKHSRNNTIGQRYCKTYTETAEEEKEECLTETSDTDYPEETNEHRHTENVLNSRQKDAEHHSQVRLKFGKFNF